MNTAATLLSVTGVGIAHGCGERAVLESADIGPLLRNAPPVDVSPLGKLLPGVSLRRVPRFARLALLACLRAANNDLPVESSRQGIVVGARHVGMSTSCDFMDSILDCGPHLSSPTAFSYAVNNMGAGLLSLLLGVQGPCNTVMTGALSFASALDTAGLLLYSERADAIWACVVEENDERLRAAAPELSMGAEGAVCLELRRWQGTGRYVSLPKWTHGEAAYSTSFALQPVMEAAVALHKAEGAFECCHMGTQHSALNCSIIVGNTNEHPAQ